MPGPAARRDVIDAVAGALIEVSALAIEPRFAALTSEQISMKSPGEVVTVADEEAERLLTPMLRSIVAAPVVGEEACSREPALVAALGEEYAWLVDPLDGTANFVAGSADWAVMATLVHHGLPVAAWIWQPLSQKMYVAEKGAGACVDGHPLHAPATDAGAPPRGAILRRFLDPATRDRVDRRTSALGEVSGGRYCAGVEYPLLVAGAQDFALFWRTLPWDHAPGVLILEEAGGRAARPDGTDYRVTEHDRPGLLAAGHHDVWARTRHILFS